MEESIHAYYPSNVSTKIILTEKWIISNKLKIKVGSFDTKTTFSQLEASTR